MAAGLTNSAFYAMTPLVCTNIGLALQQLSWIMSITVFSGLAAQLVVGTLSDRFDRTVDLRVARLRRKIEPDPTNPAYIRTVRGVGYLFNPKGSEA